MYPEHFKDCKPKKILNFRIYSYGHDSSEPKYLHKLLDINFEHGLQCIIFDKIVALYMQVTI